MLRRTKHDSTGRRFVAKSARSAPVSARPTERAFAFLEINRRDDKPRRIGLTEIRGPYYTPMGRHYLEDILETMGTYVDSLKFAGGSFALMPRDRLMELIGTAHRYQVQVSTGGFVEHVLTKGGKEVERYIAECA